MNDLTREQNLLLETVGSTLRCRNLRQNDFEGDMDALQKAIFYLIDLSHASASDETDHAKPLADELVRRKEATSQQAGVTRRQCFPGVRDDRIG